MTDAPAATRVGPIDDRRQAIADLEARLAATPRSTRPLEHAATLYRLGLAYAEWPGTSGADGLRKALACYDAAAAVFDPRFNPVEHGRVLNAAGAAHRALGDSRFAAKLFRSAAEHLSGKGRDEERAAALNNLGLVLGETGDVAGAIDAFGEALPLFDQSTPDGRRGRLAALHNRGMARAADGTERGLLDAMEDFEEVRRDIDPDEAPYHFALDHHSIGVACSGLAGFRPAERDEWYQRAAEAFETSLEVFTRNAFPFQYALAKHNLGLARAGSGRTDDLRRAVACFEDALSVLDPRVHADAWRHALASLERVEKELDVRAPGGTRADHFTLLLSRVDDDEREALLRERLGRLLSMPDPRRHAGLLELAVSGSRLDRDALRLLIAAELVVVMELPADAHEATIRARFDAHSRLPEDEREEADRALDDAITHTLGAPQRLAVRDFLASLGWERP